MTDTPTPEQPDLLDSAVEAVPSLHDIESATGPQEDPDLLDSAVEAVPSLHDIESATGPAEDLASEGPDAAPPVPPDGSLSSVDPTPGQAIGHALAAELHTMAVPAARPTAARDLIHEMVLAGAEGEITPDLLRQELPPAEFTEADYAAYDAQQDEQRANER